MRSFFSLVATVAMGLVFVPSCKDDTARAPSQNTGGTGEEAGGPGAGGSAGTSDISGEAGGAAKGSAADLDVIREACERACPTEQLFAQTEGVCEGDSVIYHAMPYGLDAEIPASESPRCAEDDELVQYCVAGVAADPCWQVDVWSINCMAEGVWVCDGGTWSEKTCPGTEPECGG